MEYKLREVVAEVTKKCNMNCMHCGSGCNNEKPERELTVNEWYSIIFQLAKMNVEKIIFSGGEPTERAGMEEIIKFTVESGMKYGLITNALNFPESLFKTMLEYRPFSVGVSIDGFNKTHNTIRRNSKSWLQIIKLVEKLNDNDIQICAITTINKMNYMELPILAELISLAEIDSWQLQVVMPAGRAKEQKDFLIDEEIFRRVAQEVIGFRARYPNVNIQAADCFGLAPENIIRSDCWDGCSAGIASMGIDSEGNVMPCLSIREEAKCGNIRESTIVEIWNESNGFDFNRKFRIEDVEGDCEGCDYLNECRGGCASLSMAYNNRYHDVPFCFIRNFL